jgi:cell division protein FtsB
MTDEPLDDILGPPDPAESGAAIDAPDAEKAKTPRHKWAPRTRISVASLALVAMMFLFVFPTRSYLEQQHQVGQAEHSVQALNQQNKILEAEAKRLQTPSEIERLAREEFNWVMPGEQAYSIGPSADAQSTTTTTTP